MAAVFVPLLLIAFIAVLMIVVPLIVRATNDRRVKERAEARLAAVSELTGDRLLFRLPEQGDREFLLQMSADPAAAEANGWTGLERKAIQAVFEDPAKLRAFQHNELVAVEQSSGLQIGTATFSNSPYGPQGSRQVGIHVHPDHRHKGYGLEIMTAGISLLQRNGAPAFVGTRATNAGLRRIMDRLGYVPEPGTHTFSAPNGDTYEALWYRCG